MELDHSLVGPIVFDTETTYSVPQHFVRGCSYTISLWAWIWPPREYAVNIIRTRPISMDERLISSDRMIFPTIQFNTYRNSNNLFISVSLDANGIPSGFWIDNYVVPIMEWFHITMDISASQIIVYINGSEVRSLDVPFSPADLLSCPYNFTQYKLSNSDLKLRYTNNTVMQVFGHKKQLSTTGMVQDVIVLRRQSSLLTHKQVRALASLRPAVSYPTLHWMVHEYYNISGKVANTSHVYAIANSSSAVSSSRNMRMSHYRRVLDAYPPVYMESLKTRATVLVNNRKELKRKRSFDAMKDFDEIARITNSSSVQNMGSSSVSFLFSKLYSAWNGILSRINHIAVEKTELQLTTKPETLQRVASDARNNRSYTTGVLLSKAKNAWYRSSSKEHVDVIDASNRRVMHEVYESAILWMNGRHQLMDLDADVDVLPGMQDWRDVYYELSQSALTLYLFMCDDIQYLYRERTPRVSWTSPYASQESLRARLMLGNRHGFDNSGNLNLPTHAEFMSALDELSNENTIMEQIAAAVESRLSDVKQELLLSLQIPDDGEENMGDGSVDEHDVDGYAGEQIRLFDTEGAGVDVDSIDFEIVGMDNSSVSAIVSGAMAVKDAVFGNVGANFSAVGLEISERYVGYNSSDELETLMLSISTPIEFGSDPVTLGKRGAGSSEAQCMAALTYYLPAAHFSAAHANIANSGVAPLEEVRIAEPRALVGHTGEDDELHVLMEGNALQGDAEADIWLARRYYFGYGGLQRNEELALRYVYMYFFNVVIASTVMF